MNQPFLIENDTPMMRQYGAIKKAHNDKIVFFRMGDFYEMFGDDAVCAAKVLQITLTSRHSKSPNPVPMCGIPYHSYESYLNKLTAAGYKVAICEQMEDPATAKGLVKREVTRIVTPGTTVSPQLIEADQNHYLAALFPSGNRKVIGLAFVDVSTGEFEAAEFSYNKINQFYDFIYQINPQEILIPLCKTEAEQFFSTAIQLQLTKLLKKSSQMPSIFNRIESYSFDFKNASQGLTQHFKIFNLAGFGLENLTAGISAAGALIHYLSQTQKCDLGHITTLKPHRFEEVMSLSEATFSHLEIFESSLQEKRHTLFEIMNKTQTPMGARLLRQWLRQPLLNQAAIEARYDAIDDFGKQFRLCETLRQQFKSIQDLPRIAGRISLPIVSIQDMVGLRHSLVPLETLAASFCQFKSPLLQKISQEFDPLNDVVSLLQKYLMESPGLKLREGGFIAEGLSEELDELRSISLNTKQVLTQITQRERELTGISSLKISYNRVFGYYIEISNAHRAAVPERFIRKQTLVNAERYITGELKELEEKILGAQERIQEIEYQLFQELKIHIVVHIGRIQKTAHALAQWDLLSGWASVSQKNNYVRPQLLPLEAEQKLILRQSRHPVIEQLDLGEPFIPNDLFLDAEHRILVITGPNMAGKSTFMRQVALNVLMAQCGCFIPASAATISLVDQIFTRIGASDHLSRGQSTFMVEMNETAAILHNASDRSLMILDEIGRGTSTFDGISIAWAVLEHIHQIGSLTLFATHYHELTAIAKELPSVQNFNVLIEEQGNRIVFMHKIVEGEADRSYGVHVAQLAGLPEPVIQRAQIILQDLESHALGHFPTEPSSVKKQRLSDPILIAPSPELPPSQQLSFFMESPSYVEELRQLSVSEMTPIEALCYLDELVKKTRKIG